jgi:hypothetical protein
MKNLAIIVLFLGFAGPVQALSISVTCTSESGQPRYDLFIDTESWSGEIRYRYLGQDAFYTVFLERAEPPYYGGIAVFDRSVSGERKGRPFNFLYDLEKNVFRMEAQ